MDKLIAKAIEARKSGNPRNPFLYGSTIVSPQTLSKKIQDFFDCLQIPVKFSSERLLKLTKALIIFVAYHPPSMAAKLFEMKHSREEPLEDIYQYKMETKKHRHWKYIVSKMLDFTALERSDEDPLVANELYRLATIKSTAVVLTQFANLHNIPQNLFSALIGYWIAKLYSISFYRASVKDLPEPFPTLYSRFLTIYGKAFDTYSPEFSFDPHMFENREAMLSFFPFLKEQTQSEPVSSKTEKDIYETMFLAIWDFLGEDDIRKFVTASEDWEARFSAETKDEAKFELAEKQATLKEMTVKAAAKKAAKKKEKTKREETEKKALGNDETK